MRRSITAALAVLALPPAALAQGIPPEAERALLQRQQSQDEFALRTRQFEQRLNPALTAPQRDDLDRRQLRQRIEQRELHDSQLQRQMQLLQSLPNAPDAQQRSAIEAQNAQFARERAQELYGAP